MARMVSTVSVVMTSIAAMMTPMAAAMARAPVGVVAQSDNVVRKVSFADLDLASSAGERTMEHRVRSAAFEVCTEVALAGDGLHSDGYSPCVYSAIDEAKLPVTAAIKRAHELAATGRSSMAAVAAISVSAAR